METALGLLLIFGILFFLGWLQNIANTSMSGASFDDIDYKTGGLKRYMKVSYKKDHIELEPENEIEIYKIFIKGIFYSPYDKTQCKYLIKVTDITYNAEDPLPIISLNKDTADKNGYYQFVGDITLPYKITKIGEATVGMLIPEALILPYRGDRQLKITAVVFATVTGSEKPLPLASASTTLMLSQKSYGYMEQEERSIETNKLIAEIALSVCAADDYIDKRETSVIQDFFSEHFARLKNPDKIREAVNMTMKNILEKHKNKQLNVSAGINYLCNQLLETDNPAAVHSAYELAVRIVAADEEVQDDEQRILKKLSTSLEIPNELAKEIKDKIFTVSMFAKNSEATLLDMPMGLSKNKKIIFLNKEYQKWRARVNHKDEKIRTEAEIRIQAITKLRQKLEKESDNV